MNHAAAHYVSSLQPLRDKYPVQRSAARVSVARVVAALEEFMEVVRYLNTRRTTETILDLADESAVQDALYIMLRPWIPDLVPEDPDHKIGNRFSIKDFVSRHERLIIEAKFVRDRDHGKRITKELHDDIETYRHDLACDDIIFFIFDPDTHIPDSRSLTTSIVADRTYDGRRLTVHIIIRP